MIAYKVCFRQINPQGGFKNVVFILNTCQDYLLFITNKEGGRERRQEIQVEEEDSHQKCCDMFWSRVWKGLVKLLIVVFVLPAIWILAVIASLPLCISNCQAI